MFIVRIAGDVDGAKRNIEVTFPCRPSLQQLCTVAEAILPLRRRKYCQHGCPLQAAATQGEGENLISTTASPRALDDTHPHTTELMTEYVVNSLSCLNRATHQWEELYSASQLTSGAQVWCFWSMPSKQGDTSTKMGLISPLPSPSSEFPVRGGAHMNEAAPPSCQLHVNLLLGTGAQQSRDGPHHPGALPEPQERLVWGCAESARGRAAHREQYSEVWGRHTKPSPLVAFTTTTTTHPPRQVVSGLVRFASAPTCEGHSSFVNERRRKDSRPRRHSTVSLNRDRRYNLPSHLHPGWSALLLSGEGGGGNDYAHLGDRLAFLFDVLVHLDPGEDGAGERAYILLRDFHALSSCLASTPAADVAPPHRGHSSMSVRSTHSRPSVMNVGAELNAQLHWTWDDLLREADKDRDGCIAYGEWLSFGIEHPEVIQLLCRAVHALLLREVRRGPNRNREGGAKVFSSASRLAPPGSRSDH